LYHFALLGRIAGFALYHRETIPAHWTTAFVKAAFGFPIVARDLESVDPELYKNEVQLIENYVASENGGMTLAQYWSDVLMLEQLTFAVDPPMEEYSDTGGAAKKARVDKVELKPGGSKIEVTEANKAEYIQLFVQHRLLGAIKEQVQAFQRGISVFFPSVLLARLQKMCSPSDLKLLLCGAEELDVDDWKASTEYSEGYSATSQQVTWFWAVVRDMTVVERAKLLDFCTGSARPPATGFANLMGYSGNQQLFRITRSHKGTHYLPTASTCFNQLKLPVYKSKKVLREKVLAAINQSEGFDEAAAV